MHIPDHMINGPVCPVTAITAAAATLTAALRAKKSSLKVSISRFAAVSAIIFAAQMMNFPVKNGTSGHVIGTVFAMAALGTPLGFLSMVLVISVQCLFFGDGGITVLGANITNMVLAASLPLISYKIFLRKNSPSAPAMFVISWMSVIFAAVFCSIEIALSGAVAFSKVFPAMIYVHSLIGIGEGIITVSAVSLLKTETFIYDEKKSSILLLLTALFTAAIFSLFASSFPDGLEWTAEKLGFYHETAPLFNAPMSDYSLFTGSENPLSFSAAGFAGIMIILIIVKTVKVCFDSITVFFYGNRNE